MRTLRGLFAALLTIVLTADGHASQRFDRPLPGARSPRNASYDIDVRLEPADRSLVGFALILRQRMRSCPCSEIGRAHV